MNVVVDEENRMETDMKKRKRRRKPLLEYPIAMFEMFFLAQEINLRNEESEKEKEESFAYKG